MMRPVPILVLIVLLVVGGWGAFAMIPSTSHYSAELPDTAGLIEGDEVRIAGISVGAVDKIEATGDRVTVDFTVEKSVELTVDTATEVKLATMLGRRYLELTPRPAERLSAGAVIGLASASGSYTMEEFWIEEGSAVGELDLDQVTKAVDVLSNDLRGAPETNRAVISGLTNLARMVNKRDEQLTDLLEATRSVTDEAVAQRKQVLSLTTDADQVLVMLRQRKEAIDALLARSRSMTKQIASLASNTSKPMERALTKLRTILKVLVAHRDDLAKTLETAEPALRLYVNASGDGPWLGVNAPYFVIPDTYWCWQKEARC